MSWKQDLLGAINRTISRRKDAIFAVHSVEQKEWGEFIVGDIFSTLHLSKHLRLYFVVMPKGYENKIRIGSILEEKRNDDMIGKRVVSEEFGAGEVTGYFENLQMAVVKFDESNLDRTLVLREDLRPEIVDESDKTEVKQQDGSNGASDAERKLVYKKKLEIVCVDSLAEVEEIGGMSNETLVDEFEHLIRNGAGPGYSRVVFMKREISKRMNKMDHL